MPEKECACDEIMAKDPTRHFRGCPKREEFPTHEAERLSKALEETCANALRSYDELMHMIDEAGFTVASGKLERKTHDIEFPSMKKIPIEPNLERDLEAHRARMEEDAKRFSGQHSNSEVRSVRDAVRFLLTHAILCLPPGEAAK